jgi:chromosomal replication initiator protein
MSGCLVQDVAKAGMTDGSVPVPDHPGANVAGRICPEDARRVSDAFSSRIGAERHAVWFGDAAEVEVVRQDSGEACAFIRIGNAFTHEWLRKTFHRDFSAAVRQVCGKMAHAEWLVAEAGAEKAAPAQPAADRGRDERATAASGHAGEATQEPPKPRRAGHRAAQSDQASAALQQSDPKQSDAKRPPMQIAQGNRHAPRLDSFVVGPSNRMAFAAVELAAGRPGQMSPLVLHGPSGSGKTHLLEALCTHFRELHPKASAVFLSAEQFTTGFLQALHGSGLPGFRRTCRTADLLVIDDLQFFVGKRATIMEVQHTIEALQRLGRQIVFACDREPESLSELGVDLLTRLRGGMTARMLPPDEDVRRGIVKAIATRRGLDVPDDVVHYVAFHMARHARELTGAMNRLEATSHMLGMPITLGMAEEALADLVRSSARCLRLADIERAVCSAFGIEPGSLQSAQRARKVNHPRMLAMFLARKHTPAALTEIGSYFGRRSHSTVISAQKTVNEWVSNGERIVLADSTWNADEAIRRVEEFIRAG